MKQNIKENKQNINNKFKISDKFFKLFIIKNNNFITRIF